MLVAVFELFQGNPILMVGPERVTVEIHLSIDVWSVKVTRKADSCKRKNCLNLVSRSYASYSSEVATVESEGCADGVAPVCTESGSQYLARYDTRTVGPERFVQSFRKSHS